MNEWILELSLNGGVLKMKAFDQNSKGFFGSPPNFQKKNGKNVQKVCTNQTVFIQNKLEWINEF